MRLTLAKALDRAGLLPHARRARELVRNKIGSNVEDSGDTQRALESSLSNAEASFVQTLRSAGVFQHWEDDGYSPSDLLKTTEFLRRFPPGHFYSPIPTMEGCDNRFRPVEHPGITMDFADMAERIAPLASIQLPTRRYHPVNDQFAMADALQLHQVLVSSRPARLFEIGSGHSTAVALDAIEEAQIEMEVLCIEPYPDRLRSILRPGDLDQLEIVESPVQSVPLEVFTELEAGDVLFIDSTHVVRPGSDVVYELLEILPRLRPGVKVHIHDIVYPFEIPDFWLAEGRVWCEPYLLRALLSHTERYQITTWLGAFAAHSQDELDGPLPRERSFGGTSLWLDVRTQGKVPF